MNYFIVLLVIILIVIYISKFISKENFTIGYDQSAFNYEHVNYNTKKQNCDELTYASKKCVVDTVVPLNKIVCNESLSPITNNEKSYENKNIISDDNLSELETFNDLKTDIKSIASLENDLMTN